MLAYRENGETITFDGTNGKWRSAGFTGFALTRDDSGWTLTNQLDDLVEIYSPQGVLQSEATHTGFRRTLTYHSTGLLTAITQHAEGTSAHYDLTLRFTYDGKRRLMRLDDPMSRITQYGYDANDNLVSVTWPDGYVITQ